MKVIVHFPYPDETPLTVAEDLNGREVILLRDALVAVFERQGYTPHHGGAGSFSMARDADNSDGWEMLNISYE